MIGDRRHDMELAMAHHLRSIGCTYGYGKQEELICADQRIGDIRELPSLLP